MLGARIEIYRYKERIARLRVSAPKRETRQKLITVNSQVSSKESNLSRRPSDGNHILCNKKQEEIVKNRKNAASRFSTPAIFVLACSFV